jgi:hypothetical protein
MIPGSLMISVSGSIIDALPPGLRLFALVPPLISWESEPYPPKLTSCLRDRFRMR